MRERVLKAVAALMVVVFPVSMAAADWHAAMMQVSGMVLVNGLQAARSTAVFSGDKIQTQKDSAVNLTVKGSSVMLLSESAAVYRGDGIELASGSAVVTTQEGMTARVQKLVISPASKGSTKFQVTRSQGELLISALRGAVSIADGGSTTMVNEGNSATVPDPAAPAPPPVAGGAGGLSTAWAVGVGLAVAAAAAGIAIGTTGTPSSPARP